MDQWGQDARRLAGLYQQLSQDCKAVPPLVTELAARGARLAEQLRAVGETLGMFLNSLDKVAVEATRSHGAGREVGEALAGVVACHKEATTRLNRLTGCLGGEAIVQIKSSNENFKQAIVNGEKRQKKEYRKMREVIKKKEQQMEKHVQKRGMEGLGTKQIELERLCRELEQHQREAVNSIGAAERAQYGQLTSWLVPIVEQELGMVAAVTDLDKVLEMLVREPSTDFMGEEGEGCCGPLPDMGSRSSSTDSITSMVSLMAPINPSPLFSRREGEGGAKELRRSRSASICNLVTLGKPAPCPSTPSGLLDEDARSRAPSFCTVRRRSCSPLTLREESGRTPKRLPAHKMGSRLDVMEECPGEGSRRERSTEEGSSGESSGLGSSREGSSGEGSSGEGSSGEGSPGTRRGSNGYFSSEAECVATPPQQTARGECPPLPLSLPPLPTTAVPSLPRPRLIRSHSAMGAIPSRVISLESLPEDPASTTAQTSSCSPDEPQNPPEAQPQASQQSSSTLDNDIYQDMSQGQTECVELHISETKEPIARERRGSNISDDLVLLQNLTLAGEDVSTSPNTTQTLGLDLNTSMYSESTGPDPLLDFMGPSKFLGPKLSDRCGSINHVSHPDPGSEYMGLKESMEATNQANQLASYIEETMRSAVVPRRISLPPTARGTGAPPLSNTSTFSSFAPLPRPAQELPRPPPRLTRSHSVMGSSSSLRPRCHERTAAPHLEGAHGGRDGHDGLGSHGGYSGHSGMVSHFSADPRSGAWSPPLVNIDDHDIPRMKLFI